MQSTDVSQILAQIRAISAQATQGVPRPNFGAEPQPGGFTQALKDSLNNVNELQQKAASASAAFERGEPGTDIAAVMVAMQKASLSFQAVAQVRNRLVSAYQDVMNMSV